MRNLLTFICLMMFSHFQTSAQNSSQTDSVNKDKRNLTDETGNKVFTKIEVEPQIDKETWSKFLKKNINYDIAVFNDAPRGIYNVKVKFIVFTDGHVGNVIALTKFGYGMEEEVVKAIKKSPDWMPAKQNGRFVNAIRIQTVRFAVEEL